MTLETSTNQKARTVQDLISLKGRKALVTGAVGHIGKTVAQTLIELGAIVTLTDHQPRKLGERAREIGLTDDDSWVAADLTSEPETVAAFRVAADRMGGLDILVHCAALTGAGEGLRSGWAVPFPVQAVDAFKYSLNLNLVAPFLMAQEFLEEVLGYDKNGVMVIFGSIYGLVGPQPSLYEGVQGVTEAAVGYSAAKGGVVQMTRHLAAIMAPNIRVNSLVPGGILRGQPEEFIKRYSQRTPLGRMGVEDDLKGAVAFLCSDMSEYMTGQTVQIDGGWTIW